MATLRAGLTWVLLPVLVIALAPDLVRLVQSIAGGWVFDWARRLGWLRKAGLILIALAAAAIPVLRKLEARSDLLAARRFVPFWTDCRHGSDCTGTVRFAGRAWLITARPVPPGQCPAIEFQIEPDRPTPRSLIRRAHRLCALARTITARNA